MLVVLVVVSIGLPGFFAYRLVHQQQQQRYGQSAEAFLAVALRAYLAAAADDVTPGCNEWLERLVERNERVRWAGVFDQNREGFEFRRLTGMRREEIVEQVAFDADSASLRPLVVRGRPSRQFFLLTVPQPDQSATLAAVVDVGAANGHDATPMLLAGLACVGLMGIVLALAWFSFAIQRPIRSLNRWVTAVQHGLVETALEHVPPDELRELVCSVEETRQSLRKWRGQAGQLRLSVEEQVEQRSRRAERALNRARHEADTDPLTGLHNRRMVQRELPKLFEQHASTGRELTTVLFDVDRFKRLNDELGHQAGDELLTFLGGLILATVRKQTDLAVRYGGDEFLLVLPDTRVAEAEAVARRLHALFMQHTRTLGGLDSPPGLSIGIAALQQHRAESWDDLLEQADAAMYGAKQGGTVVAMANDAPAATAGLSRDRTPPRPG